MSPHNNEVVLGPSELALLSKPVNGQGGFQSLLKELRGNLHGNVLTLTPSLRERIQRYIENYGDGGFERRLGGIAAPLFKKGMH